MNNHKIETLVKGLEHQNYSLEFCSESISLWLYEFICFIASGAG